MENYAQQYFSLNELLVDYRKTGKCLASFNVNDIYDMIAMVEAANEMDTHLMVMTYPPVAELISPEVFRGMVDGIKHKVKNNIYLHLDHSTSVELCKRSIDAGYDAVMFDGSALSLEENIRLTREVVEYAHARGVVVEAEIGKILGRGTEAKSDDDFLANVDDVKRLWKESGADMLAVGIGTAHGFTPTAPKIHFDRLKEIADVVSAPLVLHGGTGIPDEDIQRGIDLGISKINIGTIVHTTYMQETGKEITKAGMSAYPAFVMKEVIPRIREVVKDRLSAVNFK